MRPGSPLSAAVLLLSACAAELRPPPQAATGWSAPPDLDDYVVARALMVPVAGVSPAEVPDTFHERRGGGRLHEACDIPAPRGTPVLSVDDGTIVRVGVNRYGGNMIYATDPGQRLVYYYAHLEQFSPGLSPGRPVRRGDVLGTVGTTGNAPARFPHLHFQLMRRRPDGAWHGGAPIDARPYFASPGRYRGRDDLLM